MNILSRARGATLRTSNNKQASVRVLLFAVILVLSVAACLTGCKFFQSNQVQKQNVLLIILDTLRADHLGHYGYSRQTSPNLDEFAKNSLAFEQAISAAPWTPPSVATMFTGLYPSSHGMMPPDARELARAEAKRLDSSLNTLAEILSAEGFLTGAISPNPWITEEFGYNQGFQRFHYHARQTADFITREGLELIDDFSKQGKNFFVSLHYLDPHDPYKPPAPFDQEFVGQPLARDYPPEMVQYIDQYDGEIKFLDQQLGVLFKALKDRGLFEDLGIVIVADHGEQFLEHGDHRHGYQLYNEEIRVPLFVKPPKLASGRRETIAVSTVDVFPTLLDMSGTKLPEGLPGVSLQHQDGVQRRKAVLSEIDRKYHQRGATSGEGLRGIAGTFERGKEVPEDFLKEKFVLFDSVNDPYGLNPIEDSDKQSLQKGLLRDLMALAKSVSIEASEEVEVEPETLEQLRSLGYLE